MATSRSKHARSKKPAPKAARSSSSRGAQEQRPGIIASHAIDLIAVGLATAALLVALVATQVTLGAATVLSGKDVWIIEKGKIGKAQTK